MLLVPISAHALFARPLVVVARARVLAVEVLPGDGPGACCGATGGARRPAARARGSRSRGATCRCGSRGCTTRRSPTGWSPSSGCRSQRLARRAVRPEPGGGARSRRLPTARSDRTAGRAYAVATAARLARVVRRCVVEEMRIQDLGVIDDAVLELAPGFTVVTGETGAGKTMVVTGLGLLFGGRADAGAVRPGADRAVVEGRIVVDPTGPRSPRGPTRPAAELDDGALIVSRSVSAEGRSRAHLGGRSVPVGAAGRAGRRPGRRARPVRPAAAAAAGPPARGARPVRRRRARRAARAPTPGLPAAPAGQRASWSELDHPGAGAGAGGRPAAVRPGGDREGRPRSRARTSSSPPRSERLAHADALRAAADGRARGARSATRTPRRGRATRRPARRAARSGARARSATTTRRWPRSPTGSPRSATCSPTSPPTSRPTPTSVDADPARLAAVQERRAELTALTRKYGAGRRRGPRLGASAAAARLAELEGDDDRIEELRAEHAELAERLADAAAELTAVARARRRAVLRGRDRGADRARDAARRASTSTVDARPPTELGPRRRRRGRAAAAPRTRARPPRRCSKGASGGELSRVMLAHRGRASPAPTRCRRSCSTRSTRASAARPPSRSAAGWRGSPAPPR